MRVLTVFAALGLALGASSLFADRADAAYSDGGPIVLGNFSQGAYGASVDHSIAPREEPRGPCALRPLRRPPTSRRRRRTPKSVTAPRKEEEGHPPCPCRAASAMSRNRPC